jgi:hypothetical protein
MKVSYSSLYSGGEGVLIALLLAAKSRNLARDKHW